MTGPQAGVRLLIVAPSAPAEAVEVARAAERYAPSRATAAPGVASDIVAALSGATGLPVRPHGTPDGQAAKEILDEASRAEAGACLLLAVPTDAVGPLVAHALGAPPSAASRIAVVPTGVSVLESDADGRWAVVRVNEGAYPSPGA